MTGCVVLINFVLRKLTVMCLGHTIDTGTQEGSCPNPSTPEQEDWPGSCRSSAAVCWVPQDNGHREASHCHHHTATTNSKLVLMCQAKVFLITLVNVLGYDGNGFLLCLKYPQLFLPRLQHQVSPLRFGTPTLSDTRSSHLLSSSSK